MELLEFIKDNIDRTISALGVIVAIVLSFVKIKKQEKSASFVLIVIAAILGLYLLLSTDFDKTDNPRETSPIIHPVESENNVHMLEEPMPTQSTTPAITPSPTPDANVVLAIAITEANELFSKVQQNWPNYDEVKISKTNCYVDNGDLVYIIDWSKNWTEYYYIDGEVRFVLIKDEKFSEDAIRLYFYNDELIRLINREKEYIYADDNSDEFEEMKIYASKAATAYSDAMSYIQRFEPEVLK